MRRRSNKTRGQPKMKHTIKLAAALFLMTSASANAQDLKLTTEDYAPYNFMQDGQIVGLGADQVFEIMRRTGISHDAEMMQWSRALGLAESTPNTCVFTAAHTEERDARFSWVEPLVVDRTLLIRKAGSGVNPADLEAAKAFTVGTQANDFTEELLKTQGFPNIDTSNNFDQALQKLDAGRIDLMSVSETFYQDLLSRGAQVEEAAVLSEVILSMACNPNTSSELIARMQEALDEMISDGTQEAILNKYN